MSLETRINLIGESLRDLVARLSDHGFEFERAEEVLPGPEMDTQEAIARIEKEAGVLPEALKLFWLRIGSVDLCGSHPDWEGAEYPDPMVVAPASFALQELEDFLSEREERLRCNFPYHVPIAPDDYHKANVSGGPEYCISVPAVAADPPLNKEWHKTTFVNYLEIALTWAGFPGLSRYPGHNWPIASWLVECPIRRLAHRCLASLRQRPHAVRVAETQKSFDYDVAIIGGGSGGYAAARVAANAGLKAVVIEGGEEVGGLCILRGCMPTKALLYAAEVMHLASHAEPWGIRAENVSFNFKQVMARKDLLVKGFADYRHEQLRSGKFGFVRANARFVDAHTLELLPLPIEWDERRDENSKAVRTLAAKYFIIATGSKVAPSPVECIDPSNCLDSDTALKLTRLPKSIIVLGGGATACEFSQFFQRFGVKVTLIQRSSHVLHEFDSDAASELERVFRREGMTVYAGTKIIDSRKVGSQKEVIFECDGKPVRVRAEEIFYGLGRVPNTDSLGLDKIGVATDCSRVVTNHFMQSNLPHIYAVGDCTGRHEIVHIAVQQGEVAGYNVAHADRMKEMNYRLLTEVIFTEPQIAAVGLTEKKAQKRKIPYLAASYPFNDHGKSLIMEAKDGFVKLLADPVTGEIIGGCCVGPYGGDLIHEIIAAMYKRMTVHELAAMPHYHPTLAEIWTYPAEELAEKIAGK